MISYFVGDLEVWIVLVNIVAFVCRMLILSTQLSESECFGTRNHTRLWDTMSVSPSGFISILLP